MSFMRGDLSFCCLGGGPLSQWSNYCQSESAGHFHQQGRSLFKVAAGTKATQVVEALYNIMAGQT